LHLPILKNGKKKDKEDYNYISSEFSIKNLGICGAKHA